MGNSKKKCLCLNLKVTPLKGRRIMSIDSERLYMVFTKLPGPDILLLCLYIDDIIYMGSSIEMLSEFKDIMVKIFEMSYLGRLRYFLGLEVRQFNGALFVTQTKYAKDLLKRDGMLHSKDAISPMNINEKLQLEDCSGSADSSRYKRLVGRILYLTHTKLDIMYAVGMVSSLWLVGFTDNDWGGSRDDRRSTSGWTFSLGSVVIAWCSKKQPITALLNTEVAYISATSAA
ncbi:uncharacterized mitochondrial protein AtMg00810-like [Dioscorea cayenensis subsp. rotundata]|uniref:Uncharacterized mitochondrial protein AtMg00810-like n=1 Tax=Dioscorea cayennensis subsp. rotundata TaxID=55577 RepID=A0AB40D3D3_DIOCR|nr:uncharacterized mitochondrial protein AtMg00810-like [Dioscorea cayenensis subsp. rotundata]